MRQIRKYQKSSDLLIPKKAFGRLVREVASNFKQDLHFQSFAMCALHEACEAFLIALFEDCQVLSIQSYTILSTVELTNFFPLCV